MTTYKNPWHSKTLLNYGPEFYETSVRPIIYKNYLIYNRHASVWDVVKGGVCITQMAGLRGAQERIDLFTASRPLDETERFWVERAMSYLSA